MSLGTSSAHRVLHVFRRMDQGGAESRTMDIYRKIDKSKIQFDFLTYSQGSGYYDEEIRMLGGRIFVLPPPDLKHIISHIVAMYLLLSRESGFSAVHSHGAHYSGLVVTVARAAGIKRRICHARTAPKEEHCSMWRKLYYFVSKTLMLCNATNLLACSHDAGEYLYGDLGTNSKRFKIIRNAVDVDEIFQVDPGARERLRKLWNIQENTKVLGHIGRFADVKNHSFLICIAEKMKKLHVDFLLVLVGDGENKPNIVDAVKIRELSDCVIFLGSRADVPDILSAIDFLLLPSKHEGVPGVVIEAQAAGIPCVVSDVVTKEVDIGLGLIQYAGINNGPDCWVSAISSSKDRIYDGSIIEKSILKSGYDIQSVVEVLEGIYLT